MPSEWLRVMLEEIARKRAEAALTLEEERRRQLEARPRAAARRPPATPRA
jgi:hypothetical protein